MTNLSLQHLDALRAQLHNVKTNGKGFTAQCPAHDDKRNSLSVSCADDEKILLHCFAGCGPETIVSALGLKMSELFSTNGHTPARELIATYDYTDERGKILYQCVRFDPKDFRQRRPDGAGGWQWTLNGTRRVLYRLPELLARPDELVFVVEGEKDADNLARLGLLATTNAGGANTWRDEYAEMLRGRQVVIIPDNDDAGRQHAARVARSLQDRAASVKILELPNLPAKGDVSDWLQVGGDKDKLLELAAREIGLTETETRKTIVSAARAGAQQPRAIPEPTPRVNGNGQRAAADDAKKFAHPYLVRDGAICRRRQTPDGEVIVPLCNFSAEITAEVARDDGAEVLRLLTIEAKHADGYALPTARVDAAQFASFKWLAPSFGTRAIVVAGQSSQDHLRAAIQHLSTNVQAQHVYTHTGWREIDGQRAFLTASGALGFDRARVELDKELCRYALPPQPTGARAALQASLRFLEIAPRRVTLPLWAAMFLAPLAEFLTLDFCMWLYGVTGVMKSTAAALALSHFGDFERKDLISWSNTANHIEKITFLTKDVPIVLDDFAPQSDAVSQRNLEGVVSRIVRGVGNQSGRGRLRSDLSLRPTYRPRGLVIATGEQLPDGQSLVARLVTVEIERGDVDPEKLSAAQDERELYPHAMAGYVQWLAANWDAFAVEIPRAWKDARTRAHRAGLHLRLPEAIASLVVALDLALRYAEQVGAISEADAQELLRSGWDALTETSERQAQLTEEEKPTRKFLTVLGELISQGSARLTDLTTATTPQAQQGTGTEFLGWCDQDYLYLLPSEAYRRVSEFARQQGRHFGIKEMALRKALAEENLIETESDPNGTKHFTVHCSVNGGKRVLKVRRGEFEKVAGVIS